MRRIFILVLLILTNGIFSTIAMSAAHAGCTSYEQCPNDPNSGFTSPEQAAATAAAAAAQQSANAPEPGPISPLAASIPNVPLPPVRDPNTPVDPTAEAAAAQARAAMQAQIYADAKAKTDAAQALLPPNSCQRIDNYNNSSCVQIRTDIAKAKSDAAQALDVATQKLIDSQLPATSCQASQNRFTAECVAAKTSEAVQNNKAINISKLKYGYLLDSASSLFTPSSTVTLVLSAKGVKTKTFSTQVTSSGQILLPSTTNLGGYLIQIKNDKKVLQTFTVPRKS
jgi:hypothetical protein